MRKRVTFIVGLPDLSKYEHKAERFTKNVCRRYMSMVSRRKERTAPDYKLVCVCDGMRVYEPCTNINLF